MSRETLLIVTLLIESDLRKKRETKHNYMVLRIFSRTFFRISELPFPRGQTRGSFEEEDRGREGGGGGTGASCILEAELKPNWMGIG